jgi:hypothetical protein
MQTLENKTAKRSWLVPTIVQIKLDNEIALVLESTPPEGPGEGGTGYMKVPEYFNNDPFKMA